MVYLHPFPVPVEGVRYQNSSIVAVVDKTELGKGTLFVTESEMSWISGITGEGFSIQYKKMSLHAISRDENVYPVSCLYIMLNGVLDESEAEAEVESDEDHVDPDEVITEIKFAPEDSEILPSLYTVVQECTLLHPDSASDMTGLFKDIDEEVVEEEEDADYGGGGDPGYEDNDEEWEQAPGLHGAGDGAGSNGTNPHQFDDPEV